MKGKNQLLMIGLLTITYTVGVVAYMLLADAFDFRNLVFLLLTFGMIIFIARRWKSVRSGEPLEDEMTIRLREKASARAFYMSLYLWLVVHYIFDMPENAFMTGLIGMVALFVINYMVLKGTGSKLDS